MENNNITISLMTLHDLDKIKDILETDFDDFWNYSVFKSELENNNSKYFAIHENNQIVGFIGILVILDEADITNLVVKKSSRGTGRSNILMKYVVDFCKNNNISKINLEVNSNNTIAINLYKKFGFIEVGLRKNYYKDGDGLLFTKCL